MGSIEFPISFPLWQALESIIILMGKYDKEMWAKIVSQELLEDIVLFPLHQLSLRQLIVEPILNPAQGSLAHR